MKLKTVEVNGATYAEIKEGRPVYVADDGREIAFDAPGTVATIGRLNGEAKAHRERAESAEGKIKAYEGIADPAVAIKALETVKALDAKRLIDAGEVEKVRAEAIKAVEDRYKPLTEKAAALEAELRAEKIGGSFARSDYIAKKLAPPVPLIEATFGKHFSLADGKIVAKDASGNVIYSKARPGEVADFDEAMEVIVEGFQYRDSILKGAGQSGGGARPGAGLPGQKAIPRAQFEAVRKEDPAKAMQMIRDGFTVTN